MNNGVNYYVNSGNIQSVIYKVSWKCKKMDVLSLFSIANLS